MRLTWKEWIISTSCQLAWRSTTGASESVRNEAVRMHQWQKQKNQYRNYTVRTSWKELGNVFSQSGWRVRSGIAASSGSWSVHFGVPLSILYARSPCLPVSPRSRRRNVRDFKRLCNLIPIPRIGFPQLLLSSPLWHLLIYGSRQPLSSQN